MGINESRIEEQEKFVNEKIKFIKSNYPNEWDDLIKTQGMKRITGKIRSIYNNTLDDKNYFNHNNYKCFNTLFLKLSL